MGHRPAQASGVEAAVDGRLSILIVLPLFIIIYHPGFSSRHLPIPLTGPLCDALEVKVGSLASEPSGYMGCPADSAEVNLVIMQTSKDPDTHGNFLNYWN